MFELLQLRIVRPVKLPGKFIGWILPSVHVREVGVGEIALAGGRTDCLVDVHSRRHDVLGGTVDEEFNI